MLLLFVVLAIFVFIYNKNENNDLYIAELKAHNAWEENVLANDN